MIAPMFRALRLAVVVPLLVAAGCAINPVSGRPEVVLLSADKERRMGEEEARKIQEEVGLLDHGALPAYLDELGARLAEQSPRQDVEHRFFIAEMIEPNAFALPGGYVYVTRGLLPLVNSEDELAGVVGHEIGHVAARHSVQQLTREAPFAFVTNVVSGITGLVSPLVGSLLGSGGDFITKLVSAPYSREQEREADRVGQEIAARAGWNPAALSAFLDTLEREVALASKGPRRTSFLDSHPATPERVEKTAEHARELTQVTREPLSASRDAFLARLDGLVVGPRAADGVFAGQVFLHPDLDFHVRFPDQWTLENGPQQVAATTPDGAALAMVGAVGRGDDPMEGAKALEKASGAPVAAHTKRGEINGLPAARTRLQAEDLTIEVTWIASGGLIFQVAGIAPSKSFAALQPAFEALATSFRPLTSAERASIRENRLRLVKARAGESAAALAARVQSAWSAEEIAVANGLKPGEPLREGHTVKVAIAEPYVSRPRR